MADLRKYISKPIQDSHRFGLYFTRLFPIGSGKIHKLEALYLKVEVSGKFNRKPFRTRVEVTMPDLEPKGVCKIVTNGFAAYDAKYWDENGVLRITIPDGGIRVYPESNWTWIGLDLTGTIPITAWFGAWPSAVTLSDKDLIPVGKPSLDTLP